MKDCKHEYFHVNCTVCWFKVSRGIKVEGTPSCIVSSDKDTLQNMALKVAEIHLNKHLKEL